MTAAGSITKPGLAGKLMQAKDLQIHSPDRYATLLSLKDLDREKEFRPCLKKIKRIGLNKPMGGF